MQSAKKTKNMEKTAEVNKVALDNQIKVGKSQTQTYLIRAIDLFSKGCDRVIIQSRGGAIQKAVNLIELLKKRDYRAVSWDSGTDELPDRKDQNRMIRVSTLEIVVAQ